MNMNDPSGSLVETLDRDSIMKRIDEGSRKRLGLSAHDMLMAYQSGALDEPGSVADLISLAGLLEEDDPVFVRGT